MPVLVLVAGCGGTAEPPPPRDEALDRAAHGGRLALEMERPAEATRLYRQALARARQRDDPGAIADAAIGLAAAELAQGRAREAVTAAREVRAELLRRGSAPPTALLLAEAVALHRQGDARAADTAAAAVVARGAEDADAARRAVFLRGLIAAGRRDAAGLAAARAALGDPAAADFRADARELAAREALASGDMAGTRRLAAEAAAARRDVGDYRGLGRALALEAEAARRAGAVAEAADLLLRAGRGAAARGEAVEARRWLREAETLAQRSGVPEVQRAAHSTLAELAAREAESGR